MFTAEQVKAFILHPEPIVSNTALRYFAESFLYENDTTLMPHLLERLKQSNDEAAIEIFHAYNFPQTEESIRELLDLLRSSSTSNNTKFHLLKILYNCDPQLLISFMDTVEQDPIWNNRVEQKKNLAGMNNQELLDAFRVFIEQSTGKDMGEFDTVYGDEIVKELSLRNCIDPETVLLKLRNNDLLDPSYEVPYLIQLAGLMKLEAAIPVLCGFLGAEDDLLPENSTEALVRIGTAGVITTLTEQYLSTDKEFFRLFATDVFGKIKLSASEEALLALLPQERDFTFATKLAYALCELGSSKGLPLVEAMVEQGYDDGYLNLKASIYAHCIISNTPHPSLPEWKKKIDAEAAQVARREAEMNRMFGVKAPKGTYNRLNKLEKTYISPEKIGRNDPCPCGSGKKHKKCCGA